MYHPTMFDTPLGLSQPGLFITGTGTGVGKTVITCAVAWALRQRGLSVGVCKPFATGCRRERGGLVSDDAEALAHFADCRQPLEVINPIRYAPPLAPAVAAEQTGSPWGVGPIRRSLELLGNASQALLIEGVGGLLVPLDEHHTVLDLAVWLGYPVLVVTQAGLGTLNHTAMTVRLLRDAGCCVAGLVVNGYGPDPALHTDPAMATNRVWLERMNQTPVLATVPVCEPDTVGPQQGRIPPGLLEAVGVAYWPHVLALPRTPETGA